MEHSRGSKFSSRKNYRLIDSVTILRSLIIAAFILFNTNSFAIQTKATTYSVEHGLSQSTVKAILQDEYGQMWFGTRNGLNLFNGYEFETFLHSSPDSTSIINNEITTIYQVDSANLLIGTRNGICRLNIKTKKSYSYNYKKLGYKEFVVNEIFKDSNGDIWVAAREGVYIYDKSINNFTLYNKINASTGSVNSIAEDSDKHLWIGTNNGLFSLNKNNEWRVIKEFLYNPEGTQEKRITSICFDNYSNLWVGTRNNGVFSINRRENYRIKHFTNDAAKGLSLVSDEIRTILEDRNGRIWIGTKEGVNIYDSFSNEVEKITSKTGIINSISQNSVYSLFEDAQGGIWVGTWSGGVNLLEVDYNGFVPITQYKDGENSGSIGAVSSISELNNLLYIGTENKGIIVMDTEWNTVQTMNVENTKGRLRSNHIKKVFRDSNNNLWIGFYDRGIQVYNPKTKSLIDKNDNINVYDITEFPKNVFWITARRDFIKLDLNKGTEKAFSYYGLNESTSQQAGVTLFIGRNNTLWTGSRFGLFAYNLTNDSLLYKSDLTQLPSSYDNMNVFSLAEDNSNTLWVGTNHGLFYLNLQNDTLLKPANEKLQQYIIYGLIYQKDNLWLSTNDGLIQYTPGSDNIRKFTMTDGLQSNEFIRNSVYNWAEKYLLFGGINGFSACKYNIELNRAYKPNVLVSEIEFSNKSGNPEKIFYPGHSQNKILILPPKQSKITFGFTNINYNKSGNISYYYKLEGLTDSWKDNKTAHSVGFANLKPGYYTFRVRAIDQSDPSLIDESRVSIRILRPFYATIWAYIIYLILSTITTFIIIRFLSQKRNMQQELKIEKLEHDKLNQLNELKTKFFMNVSHEFRTPLTVIHGPIERMIESNSYTLEEDEAKTMLRNTKRLINLLDQLLELRRVEKGKSKMKIELIDLNLFTKDVIQLFQTIAHEKTISIEFISTYNVKLWADRDKLEKIISNLLSNAIKFTPEKGKILLEVSENQDPTQEIVNAEISVIDNGIGMSPEILENIFNRFETIDKKGRNPKGIGIGLSLTKELVNLHHGKILVDSEIGKGTAFTVSIPNRKDLFEKDSNVEIIELDDDLKQTSDKEVEDSSNSEKQTILVVDDNTDIRKYVVGILKDYKVLEAESIEEAESILEGNMPSLIISDVILPGKSGYDFCKQIKSKQFTSHIPVILMTAKGSDDNRILGLEIGADAFIPKPFSARILKVWVEKLITSRQKMFDYYMTQIMFSNKKKGEQKTSLKDSFLESARKIIEKDIANPDLSVEMLSKQMNMSRSNLHLKFKAIINQTPSDFIRIIRLNHSAQLLIDGNHNVVEAAYSSGFNSPSYFTKCFKQYFKKTPTEFMDQNTSD